MLITLFAAAIGAATPLLFATIGEIYTEKAGNLNLGVARPRDARSCGNGAACRAAVRLQRFAACTGLPRGGGFQLGGKRAQLGQLIAA